MCEMHDTENISGLTHAGQKVTENEDISKYHQNASLSLKFKSRYRSNNYMTFKIV